MAGGISKDTKPAEGYDLGGLVVCACSWGMNSTSDPATSSFKGDIISSISYSAAGVYTVTLRDTGYAVLAAVATTQLTADNVDLYAEVGDIDTSANTVKVKLKTGATNTAPPTSNANNRVNMVVFLTRTSVTRRRS